MKETPDEEHRYRVNTINGVRYLNDEENRQLLDTVFIPLHPPASPVSSVERDEKDSGEPGGV